MAQTKLIHTTSGIELVRRLAQEGERIFTFKRAQELAPTVGLSQGYLVEALHHLVRSGWLVRLRKGVYALSSSVPGITPVHEFEIGVALVKPAAISHWSALHYHGLTEQAPRKVFVLTTTGALIPRVQAAKRNRAGQGFRVGEIIYQFIQIKRERYFGIEKVWIGEARVNMTDPERTLLDGLSMPQYCGDFAEVLHAFEVRKLKLDLDRIISYGLKFDSATAKRLGWVLESLGIDLSKLERLAKLACKGYRTLDLRGPRRGPCIPRWMIQENLPGKMSE